MVNQVMTRRNKKKLRFTVYTSGAVALAFLSIAALTPQARGQYGYNQPSLPSHIEIPSSSQSTSSSHFLTPSIVVPTDVESNLKVFQSLVPPGVPMDTGMVVLNGILRLKDADFPGESELKGPTTGITVRWKPETDYKLVGD